MKERNDGERATRGLGARGIALAGVLSAVTMLLGWTQIGFIPVPTPAARATILHIPAILAGILGGPVVGLLVGAIFGIFSFILASIPLFKDPLVAIIPRLFIGVVACYIYRFLSKAARGWLLGSSLAVAALAGVFAYQVGRSTLWLGIVIGAVALVLPASVIWMALRQQRENVALAVAAAAGTLTNTCLVLGMGVLRGYLPNSQTAAAIGVTHGIPEVVVAVIVVLAIVLPWKRAQHGGGGARLGS